MSKDLLYNYETGIVTYKMYCGKVEEAEVVLQGEFKKDSYEEIDGNWYLVYKAVLDKVSVLFPRVGRDLAEENFESYDFFCR